jgi:lipopolysaccharide export system protein LptC
MTDDGGTSSTRPQSASWPAQEREHFDRTLRLARRHSWSVRVLRVGVPVAAVLGAGVLAASTLLSKIKIPSLPVITGINGTRVTMEAPHIGGLTRDGRPYRLSAVAAAQDVTKPDILELSGVRANITTKDNEAFTMTAVSGIYNIKAELLSLTRDIELTSSGGKHALLSEAQIETAKGNVVSNKPVKVEFPNGDMRANRLELFNSGELVRFIGAVVVNSSDAAPAPNVKLDTRKATGQLPVAQHAPTRIKSSLLEMRDKEHQATFTGGVTVVQGDSVLKCDSLIVDYRNDNAGPAEAGDAAKQIRHVDGRGHVVLTQLDQTATAETLSFDAKTNKATLLGNVTVTQEQNVVRGDKLVVNLTTGEAHMDVLPDKGAHVESVFYPKSESKPAAAPKPHGKVQPSTTGPVALSAH